MAAGPPPASPRRSTSSSWSQVSFQFTIFSTGKEIEKPMTIHNVVKNWTCISWLWNNISSVLRLLKTFSKLLLRFCISYYVSTQDQEQVLSFPRIFKLQDFCMLQCSICRDLLLLQLHCEPITLLADVKEVPAGLHWAEDSGDGEAAGKEDLHRGEDGGDGEAADAGAPLHQWWPATAMRSVQGSPSIMGECSSVAGCQSNAYNSVNKVDIFFLI